MSDPPSTSPFPGDSVLSDAAMVYDRKRTIRAPLADVWPWVVQLGKNRGGWYLPLSWERWMPRSWPATRTIEPRWQDLKVGDRVDDYGFGKDEWFDVVDIKSERGQEGDERRWIVYRSDRMGTSFTWSLILTPLLVQSRDQGSEVAESGPTTELHLRFRGRIASTGLKRTLILRGGDFMDWITTAPMLAGLAERAEGMAAKKDK